MFATRTFAEGACLLLCFFALSGSALGQDAEDVKDAGNTGMTLETIEIKFLPPALPAPQEVRPDLSAIPERRAVMQIEEGGPVEELSLAGRIDGFEKPYFTEVSGSMAFVADESGLRIIDLSSGATPREIATLESPEGEQEVVLRGISGAAYDENDERAFVASAENNSITVLDLNDISSVQIIHVIRCEGEFALMDSPGRIVIDWEFDTLFVPSPTSNAVVALDVETPGEHKIHAVIQSSDEQYSQLIGPDRLFFDKELELFVVPTAHNSLYIVDTSEPWHLGYHTFEGDLPASVVEVHFHDDFRFMSFEDDTSLWIHSLDRPGEPRKEAAMELDAPAGSIVAAIGDRLYLGKDGALQVYDIGDINAPKFIQEGPPSIDVAVHKGRLINFTQEALEVYEPSSGDFVQLQILERKKGREHLFPGDDRSSGDRQRDGFASPIPR